MSKEYWVEIAKKEEFALKEAILARQAYAFYPERTDKLKNGNKVLDFGCGIGRNYPLLKEHFLIVEGYDMPDMLERCKTFENRYDRLFSNWEEVGTYDCIYASLVLQHIENEELNCYLDKFEQISPRLHLCTRSYTDHDNLSLMARLEKKFNLIYCSVPKDITYQVNEWHYEAIFEVK
jgi:cyclopropane fatty-acyl-phospholipid synthase-like methyltransferase